MLNILKFYAVMDWIKILGLAILGYVVSFAPLNELLFVHLIVASFLLAFVRSLNNFYDAKIHGERNYVGVVIKKIGTRLSLLLCFLPIILLLFFIETYLTSTLSLIFLLAFIALAYTYSAPPLRFRNRTFLELPVNAFWGIGIFSFVFLFYSMPNSVFYFFLFSTGWYYFVSETLHQIEHLKKDKKDGKITTINKIGKIKYMGILRELFFYAMATSLIFFYLFAYTDSLTILPVVFLVMNYMRLSRLSAPNINFNNLRTRIYGMEEGILYLVSFYLFSI